MHNIMRHAEDISPWRVIERNDTRDFAAEESHPQLPKVVSSLAKYPSEQLYQSTPCPIKTDKVDFPQLLPLRDLKHSLYFMRHASMKEAGDGAGVGQEGKEGQGVGKSKLKPSYALATMKRSSRNEGVAEKGEMRVSRSTPFIKNRMQSLLRHFELGASN